MAKTNSVDASGLRCELVTEFARLEELSPYWKKWTDDDEQASVFVLWEWARACWKSYGANRALCSVAVHEGDRPVGILPLARRGRRLEFLGSTESDYNDLICERGYAGGVLQAALAFLRLQPVPWKSGLLDNLSSDSKIVQEFQRLPNSLRRDLQLVFRCSSSAVVNRGDSNAFEELAAKEHLRRSRKRLLKLGSLDFRHCRSREEARAHLERFFDQHVTRWALLGLSSQFLRPERRAFYEALIDEMDPKTLRFGILQLNGKPIAFHVGFQWNGTLTWYKPTFDVNHWENSPGEALIQSLFFYASEEGLSKFDFSIGDEVYKTRFANQSGQNFGLYLESRPVFPAACCRRVARHAMQSLRRRPPLKATIKRRLEAVSNLVAHAKYLSAKGVPASCGRLLTAGFGKILWRRDEDLLYSSGTEACRGQGRQWLPSLLDSMAYLARIYPTVFTESRWKDYRGRLKRGDKVFLVHEGSETALLWVANRPEILDARSYPGCLPHLPAGAVALYDGWLSPRFRAQRELSSCLRDLAIQHAPSEFWICCSRRERAFRRAIEAAGFQLSCRVLRRAVFNRPEQMRMIWNQRTAEPRGEELFHGDRHGSPAVVLSTDSENAKG